MKLPGNAGSALPDQSGNSGKFLSTDGASASWQAVVDAPDPGPGDVGKAIIVLDDSPITLGYGDIGGGSSQIQSPPGTTLTSRPAFSVDGTLLQAADDSGNNRTNITAPGLTPKTRTITAGTGLSGGGDLTADRTLALANTSVTPGSYTSANITVDQQGRITAAANGSGSSSSLADTGWSVVNYQNINHTGGFGGANLGNGITFWPTIAMTITGARLYWPGGIGAKTLKVSIWDPSGSRATNDPVAVNAQGVYSLTFSSPASVSSANTYLDWSVTMWITDGTTSYSYTGNTGAHPMTLGADVPYSKNPYIQIKHLGIYNAGDALPNAASTTQYFPIEPVFTVP